jgi:hypothetical protein
MFQPDDGEVLPLFLQEEDDIEYLNLADDDEDYPPDAA